MRRATVTLLGWFAVYGALLGLVVKTWALHDPFLFGVSAFFAVTCPLLVFGAFVEWDESR